MIIHLAGIAVLTCFCFVIGFFGGGFVALIIFEMHKRRTRWYPGLVIETRMPPKRARRTEPKVAWKSA